METSEPSSKAIYTEMRRLQFPADVVAKAYEVYTMLDLDTVPRKLKRTKIKCYCLFQAYHELQKPFIPDPCYVGAKLGLSVADSNQSVSKRPSYKDGYVPRRTTQSPQTMLRAYITMNMSLPDDLILNIVETFESVLVAKPALLLEHSKPLVAAYLLAYADCVGIKVDKLDLARVFYINYPSIRQRIGLFKDVLMYHV